MIKAVGYAAKGAHDKLHRHEFERDEPGPRDVVIDVMFCGVCHSDVHQVKNEWGNTVYPCLPGHEIVGRVSRVGVEATRFSVGDLVGVGCMIDSCRQCEPCRAGEENYCEGPNSWLATYNGPMVPAKEAPDGQNHYSRDNTFGGYSNVIVVTEDFVIRIPDGMDPAKAAPLLCAGVTTWSPLRHWGVKAGDKVGVVGLGGLGHVAVKLSVALGCEVTVFTTSKDKRDEATALGAAHVAMEDDKKALEGLERSFDFILTTIPEGFAIDPFVSLLKRDKTVVSVGALEKMKAFDNSEIAFHRRSVAGSLIGSLAETQEVLDFCAEHGVAPDIEIIPIDEVNAAYKAVEKGDVRFRYVIDMATLDVAA